VAEDARSVAWATLAAVRKMRKRSRGPQRARNDLGSRPSYWLQPKLERIGKKWRALYGENPQNGVAGFGDTPDEAFADFDNLWFTHRGPSGFRGAAVLNKRVQIIHRRAKVEAELRFIGEGGTSEIEDAWLSPTLLGHCVCRPRNLHQLTNLNVV
jgi:hypothetical protein